MNKKKIDVFLSLVISFFLVIIFNPIFLDYKDMYLEIEMKHVKPINFQIFYTQELNGKFNEKDSVKILNASTENKFKIIKFNLKDVTNLINLRIDLGVSPEEVWIKNIKIYGQRNIELTPKELINYQTNQIIEKKIQDEAIRFFSDESDPYIILRSNDVKNIRREILRFQKFIVLYILIFFIVYFFILFVDKKLFNVNEDID